MATAPPGWATALALGDRRARPDGAWLEAITGVPAGRWLPFFRELDAAIGPEEEIGRRLRAEGRRGFAQFRAPVELYALVRWLRPDHAVETGVSSGVSSAHILRGLARNRRGTLHSIDRPTFVRGTRWTPRDSPVALPPGRSPGWAIPAPLRRRWDLRIGPSAAVLPALVRSLPSIGLFLHDDEHTPTNLSRELRTIRPLLRPGAIVLADNTRWTGTAFPRFARAIGATVHRRRGSDLVGLRVPGPGSGG
ncbi:MAG: class I SAM-dependent methyltransferase [Thermoplasmata archaeon]